MSARAVSFFSFTVMALLPRRRDSMRLATLLGALSFAVADEPRPSIAFMAQFKDEAKFEESAGGTYCTNGSPWWGQCKTLSKRLLPPSSDDVTWPKDFPFTARDFARQDESDDATFYSEPRLVQHFGDAPRAALTSFYEDAFYEYIQSATEFGRKVERHVDLCSSWVSHLPEGYAPTHIVGIGMNKHELEKNPRLTQHFVQNLNKKQELPVADGSVDIFTNAMSVDYLVKPLQVHQEMYKKLKPGGMVVLSFSNRFFPTKVIGIWPAATNVGRTAVAAAYLRYSGFEDVKVYDVNTGERSNPLFVIMGRKPKPPSHDGEL
eukprot:gnl/TRDRNA2_/TRDRNA2_190663_c0_seq1.p1 gnl/TRDRNA2_/TRDRNA2_190663_c0~~gnl/TRDRNA2_/TRDRNA2_190663_c0_seq1.p1  ORF type:complete len:329 (-),score=56.92 gnl/TRDRNA2_/TRDRNA2_190663_c0_seq1:191-1150(-)